MKQLWLVRNNQKDVDGINNNYEIYIGKEPNKKTDYDLNNVWYSNENNSFVCSIDAEQFNKGTYPNIRLRPGGGPIAISVMVSRK